MDRLQQLVMKRRCCVVCDSRCVHPLLFLLFVTANSSTRVESNTGDLVARLLLLARSSLTKSSMEPCCKISTIHDATEHETRLFCVAFAPKGQESENLKLGGNAASALVMISASVMGSQFGGRCRDFSRTLPCKILIAR